MTPGRDQAAPDDATVARLAISLLDLTDLADDTTDDAALALCARGRAAGVAAVCVWPAYVARCAEVLADSPVRVATVVNFPTGDEPRDAVIDQTRQALADGADEIDVVLPYRAWLGGDLAHATSVLSGVADVVGSHSDAFVKTIIESGELPDRAVIDRAAHFAIDNGARFVKTSTGKTPVSATLDAAGAILEAIAVSGASVGIKVSGGVRTLSDARAYLDLAVRVMGPEWITPHTFRFGASSLLDALEAAQVTAVDWSAYDAVLFDLDGVLTPTAEIHERAWTEMFDGFLERRATATGTTFVPFTADDYLAYVDGKPRFDGVRSFVESRGIELPEGKPDDPPGDGTISALGNAKNAAFQHVLRTDGIAPYPGSVALLDALAERGTAVAVVSSSRNAAEVLAASGLAARFAVVVDGGVAAAERLAGKPAPDTFLAAAAALGVGAARAVVVEDALSGVAAGRAGAFALVLGVDRGAGRDALLERGADVVVGDLAEVVP